MSSLPRHHHHHHHHQSPAATSPFTMMVPIPVFDEQIDQIVNSYVSPNRNINGTTLHQNRQLPTSSSEKAPSSPTRYDTPSKQHRKLVVPSKPGMFNGNAVASSFFSEQNSTGNKKQQQQRDHQFSIPNHLSFPGSMLSNNNNEQNFYQVAAQSDSEQEKHFSTNKTSYNSNNTSFANNMNNSLTGTNNINFNQSTTSEHYNISTVTAPPHPQNSHDDEPDPRRNPSVPGQHHSPSSPSSSPRNAFSNLQLRLPGNSTERLRGYLKTSPRGKYQAVGDALIEEDEPNYVKNNRMIDSQTHLHTNNNNNNNNFHYERYPSADSHRPPSILVSNENDETTRNVSVGTNYQHQNNNHSNDYYYDGGVEGANDAASFGEYYRNPQNEQQQNQNHSFLSASALPTGTDPSRSLSSQQVIGQYPPFLGKNCVKGLDDSLGKLMIHQNNNNNGGERRPSASVLSVGNNNNGGSTGSRRTSPPSARRSPSRARSPSTNNNNNNLSVAPQNFRTSSVDVMNQQKVTINMLMSSPAYAQKEHPLKVGPGAAAAIADGIYNAMMNRWYEKIERQKQEREEQERQAIERKRLEEEERKREEEEKKAQNPNYDPELEEYFREMERQKQEEEEAEAEGEGQGKQQRRNAKSNEKNGNNKTQKNQHGNQKNATSNNNKRPGKDDLSQYFQDDYFDPLDVSDGQYHSEDYHTSHPYNEIYPDNFRDYQYRADSPTGTWFKKDDNDFISNPNFSGNQNNNTNNEVDDSYYDNNNNYDNLKPSSGKFRQKRKSKTPPPNRNSQENNNNHNISNAPASFHQQHVPSQDLSSLQQQQQEQNFPQMSSTYFGYPSYYHPPPARPNYHSGTSQFYEYYHQNDVHANNNSHSNQNPFGQDGTQQQSMMAANWLPPSINRPEHVQQIIDLTSQQRTRQAEIMLQQQRQEQDALRHQQLLARSQHQQRDNALSKRRAESSSSPSWRD